MLKKEIGVSKRQLLSEAGYGDEDVKQMMAEKQSLIEARQRQFDAGNINSEDDI